ncbi:CBS domain-containing protein [Aliidiomarina sedimenti]|uniref:CBS domain-containing protein n=1 Tax=Aliidiomarina sedimenti TaxID=1933879 RepID=A0ABY0C1A0_9GAMM|nr:CBS domain-containing protein [Aliidiomarina sedimenti]RUO30836.1 CBS domain-containing protein [Aliidiomarina sedimenti]
MLVKDIMTTRPHYLSDNATIQQVAESMRKHSTGFEPLTNDDKVVAVVTDRDLVINGLARGKNADGPAKELATKKVLYTYQDTSVEEALSNMSEQQVQRLLVLDNPDSKQLVGVVTVGDIADHCGDSDLTASLIKAISHYH